MFEQTFKNIDDILHKDAGCTSELDYTEQSSWLLFLKYLDALETNKALEAELEGNSHCLQRPHLNRNSLTRGLNRKTFISLKQSLRTLSNLNFFS